jgi:hypothetical protein
MADVETLTVDPVAQGALTEALVCEVCDNPSPRDVSVLGPTLAGIAPTLLVEINNAPDLGAPRPVQSREGWVLDAAKEFDVYDLWVSGVIPDKAMASMIEARVGKRPTGNAVFRSRQAGKEQRGLERISETWTMDGEVAHYIATDVDYLIRRAVDERDTDTLNVLVDDLTDRFVAFRDRYFTLGRDRSYVTAGFHREWIASILRSYCTGGKTLILSPPRHGKSELLVHFIVWAIVRNPDIRVAWIAGNADVAGDMVSAVRNHLGAQRTARR